MSINLPNETAFLPSSPVDADVDDDSDKENAAPRLSVPKPRDFEPWSQHADFFSPLKAKRPSRIYGSPAVVSKNLSSRKVLGKLMDTPPRVSYAEKVKGIFANVEKVRHKRQEVDGCEGQLREENGVEAPEVVISREYVNANAASDSPLTSESELERRLASCHLREGEKKRAHSSARDSDSSDPLGDLERAVKMSWMPAATARISRRASITHAPHINTPQLNPTPLASPTRSEAESSDAWTDDSKFLPSRSSRKRQREEALERQRQNREWFYTRTKNLPRNNALSPNQERIAAKLGLIPKDQVPAPDDPILWDYGNIVPAPPRPSRLGGRKGERGEPWEAGSPGADQHAMNRQSSSYRASDADDEMDSDPDACMHGNREKGR